LRAFWREYPDPQIVFDVVAELLERRHVGQQFRARGAENDERAQLAGFDMRQRGRYRLRRDLGIVAEDGHDRRAAAGGREMAQLQGAGRLFQIRQRQVARTIEPARAEDESVGMCLGAVDELLQRPIRLLVVDEEQNRIRDDARERDEVGAAGLDRTAEQSVDLGVTGDAGIVRQQRVTVRLGGGHYLRADLSRRPRLGLDPY